MIQEPVPAWGYFFNLECVADKSKTLDVWKASVLLSLISKPFYAEEDREVNVTYNLVVNSFQGTVHNWYIGISSNVKNLIEINVKGN